MHKQPPRKPARPKQPSKPQAQKRQATKQQPETQQVAPPPAPAAASAAQLPAECGRALPWDALREGQQIVLVRAGGLVARGTVLTVGEAVVEVRPAGVPDGRIVLARGLGGTLRNGSGVVVEAYALA